MAYVDKVKLKETRIGKQAPCPLLAKADGSHISLLDMLAALNNRIKVKKIPFTASTTEKDTGWDLPSTAIVLEVLVEITTAEAGITMDVGLLSTETGGDADGFLDGVSVAAVGIVAGELSITKTTGVNENYISAVACTRGVFLRMLESELGTDTAGDHGFVVYEKEVHPAAAVTAKSVSYTHSAGASAVKGNIYIIYFDLAQAGELSA